MQSNNFQRMLQLADSVFDTKNDNNQLDVNDDVLIKLQKIHPSTISEYNEGNGPIGWVLLIPTTEELMNKFLKKDISEKELFEQTPIDSKYDALYLCSALVLEEYRNKGITKRLTLSAIENIRKNNPIQSLFVWPFSNEGNIVAKNIARITQLPLFNRE